jgi:hypothetical protein
MKGWRFSFSGDRPKVMASISMSHSLAGIAELATDLSLLGHCTLATAADKAGIRLG